MSQSDGATGGSNDNQAFCCDLLAKAHIDPALAGLANVVIYEAGGLVGSIRQAGCRMQMAGLLMKMEPYQVADRGERQAQPMPAQREAGP
jgi:hypothetical protein